MRRRNSQSIVSPECFKSSCLICLIPSFLILGLFDANSFVSSISFITKSTLPSIASVDMFLKKVFNFKKKIKELMKLKNFEENKMFEKCL